MGFKMATKTLRGKTKVYKVLLIEEEQVFVQRVGQVKINIISRRLFDRFYVLNGEKEMVK